MPGKKSRSLQNVDQYEALRRKGFSKESAARISNAQAPGHRVNRTKKRRQAGPEEG